MSLFNQLGNQQQPQQGQQPAPEQLQKMQQSVRDVKANPAAYLQQNFGVNVPQGANDPMQIMNHLAQSGQLNPQQMRVYQGLQRMQGVRRR